MNMDLILSNEKKIAGTIRHFIGIGGGVAMGLAIANQGDVDGLMKGVEAVFSHVEGIIGAVGGLVAVAASIKAKAKNINLTGE